MNSSVLLCEGDFHTGNNASNTLILWQNNNELLATVLGVQANTLTSDRFTLV